MITALDSERLGWIAEIFSGVHAGVLKEDDIKRALCIAGEFERSERESPSAPDLQKMEEAERMIESVLRSLPPSREHSKLRLAIEGAHNAGRNSLEFPFEKQ